MKRNVCSCFLFEGNQRSCCSDTGWKTVPCTSSRHLERSITDGSDSLLYVINMSILVNDVHCGLPMVN